MQDRKSYNVLIADDDDSFRELFRDMLERTGYNVFVASSKDELMNKLSDHDVHLVILDRRFPTEEDGARALRMIREMRPSPEVIILTAFPDADSSLESCREGVLTYLIKTDDFEKLLAAVNHAIEISRYRQENERLLEELKARNSELEAIKKALQRWNEELVSRLRDYEEQFDSVRKDGNIFRFDSSTELMVRTMIHEINSRLQVTKCLVSKIHSGDPLKLETCLRKLVEINDQIGDITRSYRELLFSNTPVRRLFSLGEVVERAFDIALTYAKTAGVSLERRIEGNTGRLYGNPPGMVDALLNLLKNAIEAASEEGAPSPGRAGLTVLSSASGTIIEIASTGRAIPDDIAAIMFEPYVTTKEQGSGIGLTVAKRTIEEHGGTIRFSRRGNENVFTVEFLFEPAGGEKKGRICASEATKL